MYPIKIREKIIEEYIKLPKLSKVIKALGIDVKYETARKWVSSYKKHGKIVTIYQKKVKTELNDEDRVTIKTLFEKYNDIHVVRKELGFFCKMKLIKDCLRSQGFVIKNKLQIKYTDEFKEHLLHEYISTSLMCCSLSKKYNISNQLLRTWIGNCYEIFMKNTKLQKVLDDSTIDNDLLEKLCNNKLTKKELINLIYKIDSTNKNVKSLVETIQKLDAENKEAQVKIKEKELECDVMKEIAKVLKKDNGISDDSSIISCLNNREKTIIINALRNKYSLKKLLGIMNISKSSYEYQNSIKDYDKYKHHRLLIRALFFSNYCCYGTERMHALLKDLSITLSEKVIRNIYHEEGLKPFTICMKKYSSYKGEISPPPDDLLQHNFHSCLPFVKMVTDITEFKIPAGKVYLSPIIDLFDGCPKAWKIGLSPNQELTNGTLDMLHSIMPETAHPIIHSDRGFHYRIDGWICRMEKYGYTRSMSRKGCSADNSACEGFFGNLKNEFFYNKQFDWSKISLEQFMKELNNYLIWYVTKRIKKGLGFVSPANYLSILAC